MRYNADVADRNVVYDEPTEYRERKSIKPPGPSRRRAPQYYRVDAASVAETVGLSKAAVLKAVKRGKLSLGNPRTRQADLLSILSWMGDVVERQRRQEEAKALRVERLRLREERRRERERGEKKARRRKS